MINITLAILTIISAILAGCFTGKVCERLDDDEVSCAKFAAISFAVLTTTLAFFNGATYSAFVVGTVGLTLVYYCAPIYKWTDENFTVDTYGRNTKSSWMRISGTIGGIIGIIIALISLEHGSLWKLAMIPGAALTVALSIGTIVWIFWLYFAVIVLLKKAFSATPFNDYANRVADRISKTLSGRSS